MKNRLRLLRAEADLSQGELAGLLGVSRQTINAVETDKYDPSLPLALRMAKVFGVPVDAIFLDDWTPAENRNG
jgi:putative transcriptional regulator